MTNEEAAVSIRPRRAELTRIDAKLRQPSPAQPKIDELRAALEQRAADWRVTLRPEPKVARVLLRRLIDPLTLWNDAVPSAEWLEWETSVTPALLEGLATYMPFLRQG
jgi:hypothetical protein